MDDKKYNVGLAMMQLGEAMYRLHNEANTKEEKEEMMDFIDEICDNCLFADKWIEEDMKRIKK